MRVIFEPARWIGMNTIFIYLMAPSGEVFGNAQRWIYFGGDPDQNIRQLVYKHVFCYEPHYDANITLPKHLGLPPHARIEGFGTVCGEGSLLPFAHLNESWATLWWTLFRIAFWAGVAGYLHRVRWCVYRRQSDTQISLHCCLLSPLIAVPVLTCV
jgi:hypothetical protein